MRSPYLAVINQCIQQMKEYMVEFGMTPSSRSRIDTRLAELPDDDDDGLLG